MYSRRKGFIIHYVGYIWDSVSVHYRGMRGSTVSLTYLGVLVSFLYLLHLLLPLTRRVDYSAKCLYQTPKPPSCSALQSANSTTSSLYVPLHSFLSLPEPLPRSISVSIVLFAPHPLHMSPTVADHRYIVTHSCFKPVLTTIVWFLIVTTHPQRVL